MQKELMNSYRLILASTSPYRAEILKKLTLPFTQISPDYDETPQPDETPDALVARLACGKAESCQLPTGHHLVIGSDQVCVINGTIIGKPHTEENAVQQLLEQSGQSITFYTGIALHNTRTNTTKVSVDTFVVHFKSLTLEQIRNYVRIEQPLYCAGSFKSEGLGITLFSALEGKDPNTLIGLPIIELIRMLNEEGVDPLSNDTHLAQ
jgi:MAF protein